MGGDAPRRLLHRPNYWFGKTSERGRCGMAKWLANARFIFGALALTFIVALTGPALAQQPSSVNPTASSVKEDQLCQEMNRISGRCTIPDQKACTIEQPAGRNWREFHQKTLPWIGAIAIL